MINVAMIDMTPKQQVQVYMTALNQKADLILAEMREAHNDEMVELRLSELWWLEQKEIYEQIKNGIAPYNTIEDWWNSLGDSEKFWWCDRYERVYCGMENVSDYFNEHVFAYIVKNDYCPEQFLTPCMSGHDCSCGFRAPESEESSLDDETFQSIDQLIEFVDEEE